MIDLCDGKYQFTVENDVLKCKRHGEEWRGFLGDKAIHALYDHAVELQTMNRELKDALFDLAQKVFRREAPSVPSAGEKR